MTAYELLISDWSSDVCSSDLRALHLDHVEHRNALGHAHDQFHLGIDRLEDRVGGERRRAVYAARGDRKSGVEGESVSVRVDLGGAGIIQKQIQKRLLDKEQSAVRNIN